MPQEYHTGEHALTVCFSSPVYSRENAHDPNRPIAFPFNPSHSTEKLLEWHIPSDLFFKGTSGCLWLVREEATTMAAFLVYIPEGCLQSLLQLRETRRGQGAFWRRRIRSGTSERHLYCWKGRRRPDDPSPDNLRSLPARWPISSEHRVQGEAQDLFLELFAGKERGTLWVDANILPPARVCRGKTYRVCSTLMNGKSVCTEEGSDCRLYQLIIEQPLFGTSCHSPDDLQVPGRTDSYVQNSMGAGAPSRTGMRMVCAVSISGTWQRTRVVEERHGATTDTGKRRPAPRSANAAERTACGTEPHYGRSVCWRLSLLRYTAEQFPDASKRGKRKMDDLKNREPQRNVADSKYTTKHIRVHVPFEAPGQGAMLPGSRAGVA